MYLVEDEIFDRYIYTHTFSNTQYVWIIHQRYIFQHPICTDASSKIHLSLPRPIPVEEKTLDADIFGHTCCNTRYVWIHHPRYTSLFQDPQQ